MVRRSFAVALLGVGVAAALSAAGCASSEGDRRALQKELAERQRWTDDKGRYHPEWRDGIGSPPGYPKGRPISG